MWFGSAGVVLGLLFLNPFVVLASSICFGYLGFRAVQFKKLITELSYHVEIKVVPERISTLVDTDFRFDVAITNFSRLPAGVMDFHMRFPPQINALPKEPREGLQELQSGARLNIGVSMRSASPGQFKITQAVLTLEDQSHLFKHQLIIRSSADLEISPLAGKIETKIQLGSIAATSHLGLGTDLARIREVVSQDDFHSIDWKSTARMGKFMKKEYFAENEPAVIMVIDKSVLGAGGELKGSVLIQLGKLAVTFGSATPVGAIIYDQQNVIKQLIPSAGNHNRALILRSLLEATGGGDAAIGKESATRLYRELVDMIRLLQWSSKNPPPGRVDVYAQSVLPYYESNAASYPLELAKKGAFRALEAVSVLSPALVLVFSSFRQDLRGLCEGAILANASGHRIVLTVIGSLRDALPPEISSLRESGVQVIQSGGAGLVDSIHQAIIDIPAMRIRNPHQIHV